MKKVVEWYIVSLCCPHEESKVKSLKVRCILSPVTRVLLTGVYDKCTHMLI